MRDLGRAGAALLALLVVQGVDAYPKMMFSQEPNNTPEQAQSVSGEVRLVGEVSSDDRDLFWWGLDDNDADRLWQIELQGDADAAIEARFSWPAEGEASTPSGIAQFGETEPEEAAAEEVRLLSLEASASQPSQRRQQLIVPPGEHLVSLLPQGAGGEYQLILTETGSARVRGQVGADGVGDLEVAPSRQRLFFHLDVAEHAIPLVPEAADELLWRLHLLGELGTPLEAWIENDAGERLAEVRADSPVQHQWGRLDLAGGGRLHLRHPRGEVIGRVGLELEADGRRPESVVEMSAAVETEAVATSEEEALWMALAEPVTLDLVPRRRQFLAFSLDGQTAGQQLDVVGDTDHDIEVCLDRRDGSDPVCRDGPAEGLFSQMQLPAGDYLLRLQLSRRADDPLPTQVRLVEAPPVERQGWVGEPNDNRDWAAVLTPGEPRQGRFQGGGAAWFELLVSGDTQTWELRAEGDPIERLALYRDGDSRPFLDSQQPRRGDPLAQRRLSPVRLLPGRYQLRLEGESSDYRLQALPLGEPQPGREVEPNDTPEDANPLWLGAPVKGHFHSEDDADHFHFHLPGDNRLVMDFDPPAGGSLEARLFWQGDEVLRTLDLQEATRISRRLPPGDYTLRLVGDGPWQAPYSVQLSIGDPWQHQGAVGLLANIEQAPLVPEDGVIDAKMGGVEDVEGYLRLPVTEQARTLYFEARDPEGRVRFVNAEGDELVREETAERHHHGVTVPGGEQWYLWVSISNRLRRLELDDPGLPFVPEPSSVAVELESDSDRLPPFLPHAQRLETRLTVHNQGEEPLALPLKAHASHSGWSLDGLPESLSLDAGERRELVLAWTLPAEILESDPPSLFVAVGEQMARHDLAVDPSVAALDPQLAPAIPEALDGQIDLAWSALGAHFVAAESGEPIDGLPQTRGDSARFLIDGMASAGSSIEVDAGHDEALPPIRLAGEGGRVHGLAFNQRSLHAHSYRWREVEIALGESLDALDTRITVELDSRDGEQYFPLEAPVAARYVQLHPLTLFLDASERRRSRHGTGALRVLGEPRGELAERRHNLLNRELGGHWIYTLPDISSLYGFQGQRYTHRSLTDERSVRRGQRISGERIEMVFAFLQHRAARLDELRWIENLDWEGLPVERIAVYTSLESPVGPWQRRAEWDLERDDAGVASLSLAEAPQARYLRLVFDEPAVPEGERNASWRIPEALQAFEADALGSGRSILGHWGVDNPRGPLEAQQGERGQVREVEDTDSHAEAPYPLVERVVGRVEEPGDARHYQLSLEAPDNTLALEFEEPARDRLVVTLSNAEGETIALDWSSSTRGRRQAEAVDIAAGDYRLTVSEPPRSIVFLWDGSGSLSNHQPAIYQALNRFAEGLEPDKEVFNMLPLGGPLLIDGWATQPAQVTQTLAAYDGRFTSSNAEPALALASRALAQREGQRAIFLITDAEQTDRDLDAWETLASVRPRIFSLEASHGSSRDTEVNRWYQNQMLSWAQIGDGGYRYSADRAGLIRGFEAGMRELRRPSEFALGVERRYQEPPEPGSLAVVNADPAQPAVAGGVVHLIFDASGSMLRQMEGGRRIEVARRIVQQTLDERIPEEVPVALRAYGHTEPHSCATELLVAPEAGSHATVHEAVSRIQAINLARTPLADSLDAVLDDLADYADQPRLVVMLTDGEETCDGDLAASVDALIEEGVEVRLNIVGFHIDEIGLQAEFERFAARGGGEYFDSHDGEALIEGLANALAATWRVLDDAGEEVARGRVGDAPIELEVGTYALVVLTQEGEQRQTFRVRPQQSVEIPIGSERE